MRVLIESRKSVFLVIFLLFFSFLLLIFLFLFSSSTTSRGHFHLIFQLPLVSLPSLPPSLQLTLSLTVSKAKQDCLQKTRNLNKSNSRMSKTWDQEAEKEKNKIKTEYKMTKDFSTLQGLSKLFSSFSSWFLKSHFESLSGIQSCSLSSWKLKILKLSLSLL